MREDQGTTSPSERAAGTTGADGVDLNQPCGFGAALQRWRTRRGLSLAGLAARVHYSKGYLSKIENGKMRANPDFARRCDEALDTGGELTGLVEARREPDRPPG